MAFLLLAAVAAVVLIRVGPGPDHLAASRRPVAALPADWPQQMLAAVNEERSRAGLKPVVLCTGLTAVAQSMAEAMAAQDFFSHTTPNGEDLRARLRAAGLKPARAAENIAAGQTTVGQVMTAWMSSPDHRANVLAPRLRRVGFGFSQNQSSAYGTYWSQDFGAKSTCRG